MDALTRGEVEWPACFDQFDGAIIELIARITAAAAGHSVEFTLALFGDFLFIIRFALRFQEIYDLLDFLIGNERSVDALYATGTWHIKHVTLSEELFSTLFAQHGPAVDLGRYLKADTGREVGLDRTSDDINRRSLRCHNHMKSGSTGHLGEALHCHLDILAGHHH